jgi:hypothetical protein
VSKWKTEALAIPDGHWQSVSTSGKQSWGDEEAQERDSATKLEGIVDEETFETVRRDSITVKPC